MAAVLMGTELSVKEPHGQVGLGRVIASGILGDVMVSVLTSEWQEVCIRILL